MTLLGGETEMQVCVVIAIVCSCGAIGGFVNALLAGDLHLPHREGNLYSPGWLGNVVIGAAAAFVFWGMYGAMSKIVLIGDISAHAPVALTVAELAGSVVTGIGGGRILSSEVEKKALTRTRDELTDALWRRGS